MIGPFRVEILGGGRCIGALFLAILAELEIVIAGRVILESRGVPTPKPKLTSFQQ